MRKPKLGSIYQRKKKQPDGRVVALPTWWIKYYRTGQPFRESSHSESYDDAERLLKRRQGEIVTGKFAGLAPERVRISALLDLVVADYEEYGRNSAADVKWRMNKHVKPALGDLRAAEFESHQTKRYVSDRRSAGAADATINRELSIVRRAFTLALNSDPPLVARAPHIPKLEEHNVREGFIDHAQYISLREKLPDHLRAIFVVGYHVGMRLGELRQLEWSQVDLRGREIRLSGVQTKNGKPRTAPIYGDMGVCLEWQLELTKQKWPDCQWVFHYLGRRLGGHLKGWSRACKEAAMPALLFHDLRRSAVRNMEPAGIPRHVAMEISGHRTEAVYRRYDIVSKQDLVAAGLRMQAYSLQETARAYLDTVKAMKDAAQKAGRTPSADEQKQITALQAKAVAALQQAAALGFPLSTIPTDTGTGTLPGTPHEVLQ
jgi:integrase